MSCLHAEMWHETVFNNKVAGPNSRMGWTSTCNATNSTMVLIMRNT